MFNFFKKKKKRQKKKVAPPNILYVQKTRKYWGTYKIGITNNLHNRTEELSRSMKTEVKPVFHIKHKKAEELEARMHRIFKAVHRPLPKRFDGHTEWFFTVFSFPIILTIKFITNKIEVLFYIALFISLILTIVSRPNI